MLPRMLLALTLIVTLAIALASGASARSGPRPLALQPLVSTAATARVGNVRAIKRGLRVQPPQQQSQPGKVRQVLYGKYGLQTQAQQLASIAFVDGSILHMNQRTSLVLTNAHQSVVKQGEVDQLVVPGTDHQVKTASAVASAIGTQFDVRVNGAVTVITVIEGAVLVSTPFGSVVVTTGQQTTITKGSAPTPPRSVSTTSTAVWDMPLPPPSPPLGENIGLTPNGGGVILASSQRSSSDGTWDAANIDDGRLDRGWASDQGRTTNEWVKLGFGGGEMHTVTGLVLDCAATGGLPASADLQQFDFKTSSSGPDDANFQNAFTGTCKQETGLQRFALPAPVTARYVELVAQSNYGSPDAVSVAELEVVSPDAVNTSLPPPGPLELPPSPSDTATATVTRSPTPTDTPVPTATETPTSTPLPVPTLAPVPTALALPTAVATIAGFATTVGWTFSAQLATINQYCVAPSSCAPKLDLTLENPVMTATVCSPTPFAAGWSGTITYPYIEHLSGNQVLQNKYTFGPVTLNQTGTSRFFRGRLSYWDLSVSNRLITLHQVFDVPPGSPLPGGGYADSSIPQMQTVTTPLLPLTKCP